MGLRLTSQRKTDVGLWELGLVKGKKRSQMVSLRANQTLELVAGQNAVPVTELVCFEAGGYAVEREAIRQLVDMASTGDAHYTPSHARREERKRETEALHEDWRREYRRLKKSRPEMSDVWCARTIARSDAGGGRSAETVRRQLKR